MLITFQCYELALKSYRNQTAFDEEEWAFRGVSNQKGIVQYLGNYSFDEEPGNPSSRTHNILLEFGELDLVEFFAETSPPIRNSEIIEFWDSMFKVADALQRFHNLEHKADDGTVKYFHG